MKIQQVIALLLILFVKNEIHLKQKLQPKTQKVYKQKQQSSKDNNKKQFRKFYSTSEDQKIEQQNSQNTETINAMIKGRRFIRQDQSINTEEVKTIAKGRRFQQIKSTSPPAVPITTKPKPVDGAQNNKKNGKDEDCDHDHDLAQQLASDRNDEYKANNKKKCSQCSNTQRSLQFIKPGFHDNFIMGRK